MATARPHRWRLHCARLVGASAFAAGAEAALEALAPLEEPCAAPELAVGAAACRATPGPLRLAADEDDELEVVDFTFETTTTTAITPASAVAQAPAAGHSRIDRHRGRDRRPRPGGGRDGGETPIYALVEPRRELRGDLRPLDSHQQRELGQLGVLGVDRLAGQGGVDRVELGGDLGVEGEFVKLSHCRPF